MVCVWEGVGDRTETEIFWPPLLWPSTLCLSRSPDAQPEALGSTLLSAGFLYCILSATSLVPKLHRGYRGPLRPGVTFLTTSRLSPFSNATATALTSVLTELYNSSTSTRSPTRSLKSHVWSSSSGNNCHAVQRSLSSGVSVYECTMGIFFTSSYFISQFPPTLFPLITAIRMCHFLPVHHLGMAFLAGSKGQNITKGHRRLGNMRTRGETIQTTALLRLARILRSIVETWEELLSLKFQWKTISYLSDEKILKE